MFMGSSLRLMAVSDGVRCFVRRTFLMLLCAALTLLGGVGVVVLWLWWLSDEPIKVLGVPQLLIGLAQLNARACRAC
jgi:hypothetical protein